MCGFSSLCSSSTLLCAAFRNGSELFTLCFVEDCLLFDLAHFYRLFCGWIYLILLIENQFPLKSTTWCLAFLSAWSIQNLCCHCKVVKFINMNRKIKEVNNTQTNGVSNFLCCSHCYFCSSLSPSKSCWAVRTVLEISLMKNWYKTNLTKVICRLCTSCTFCLFCYFLWCSQTS